VIESMYVTASSYEPSGVNWISAECRSPETWPSLPGESGERSFVTWGKCSTAAIASATTARNEGSLTVAVGDCTSTYSDCSSSVNPPSRMM